jgi:hypothetical protein
MVSLYENVMRMKIKTGISTEKQMRKDGETRKVKREGGIKM